MKNFQIGSLVKFRGREWVVMPSMEDEMITLRPLTGSEQDLCEVFLPIEYPNFEIAEFPPISIKDLGDFESAKLLRNAARFLLRHGAGPFRSVGHLSFRPRPYQFVPLLMALRLNPVRMLLADDVGIGKTIEAGLVIREFLDRSEIKRFAVLCPSYLCAQWQKELINKFNIDVKIVRTNTLARLERGLPVSSLSVFEYYPNLVMSIDFVKSQRRRDAFLLNAPDLVIIDEAHGCARPPGQTISQQQRHELVSDLAKDKSKNIILVTATPHSGIEESFLSLLGFIDPKFEKYDLDNIDQPHRTELARHFIQRRRADVVQWMGTETVFPKRDSFEVSFRLSKEYADLFKDVRKFTREQVCLTHTAEHRQRVRYWAALALMRCVMSSPEAAKASLLSRIDDSMEEGSNIEFDYVPYVLDPIDREFTEDVVPTNIVKENEKNLNQNEKRKLREFVKRAEKLKGDNDNKIKKAAEEVKNLLRDGFKPIVFCRFIATAEYVAKELKNRLEAEFADIYVISITGLLSEEEREFHIEELSKSSIRVLVATDCLSEGINLQENFNAVIHYDLPWNPNRLEQREGRVDRFGQRGRIDRFGQNHQVVKTILLYGSDNPIDGAVLDVLLRKAGRIHRSLGITVPIPTNSETLMQTVLRALFLRGAESPQLGLFDEEIPVKEVHIQWDRAAEREKRSRTLFAQHSINQNEVARELDEVDAIFGSQDDMKAFFQSACERIGCPLSKYPTYWKINLSDLPNLLKSKLNENDEFKFAFNQPTPEGVTFMSRNHPLICALAEYLFDNALQKDGERDISSRLGLIRSKEVSTVTSLILLRCRFKIQTICNSTDSIVEKSLIIGFEGLYGSEKWLEPDEAEILFNKAIPSVSLSNEEKGHWVNLILENKNNWLVKINSIMQKQANEIQNSYDRLRKIIRGKKPLVKPIVPVDIISISILLPKPN